MIKKISSIILVAIIIACANLTSFAYSTDKYEIEIPDSFSQKSDSEVQNYMSTFVSSENENCEINVILKEDSLDFNLSEKNLNFFQKNFTSRYNVSILTSEITTFTKNSYACFHYFTEYTFEENTDYMEAYVVKSDTDCYYITLFADDKEFFEMESTKNIVNSFTIKDYVPTTTAASDSISKILSNPSGKFNFNNFLKIYYVLLVAILAISMLFKIIAISTALIIVKKNNRRVASYEEENNSRQLENEQNSRGDENLNWWNDTFS